MFRFRRNKSRKKEKKKNKGTYKDSGKKKAENHTDPLLSGRADLVTTGVEKATILGDFFAFLVLLVRFTLECPRF